MRSSVNNDTNTIKSVDRALEVLEAFSSIPDGINISSLSRDLNMNKSHIFRLLQVFKQRGYVEQTRKNGKYRLGRTAYMLGQNIMSNVDLLSTAKPVMEKLVNDCNETVYLALRFGDETLLFDSVDSRHPVNIMPLKGHSYPLTECAAGEMFLAHDVAVSKAVNSCSSPARKTQLAAIKRQGYSADIHRLGDGIYSLAVPILSVSEAVAGCLCFVGPEFRFTEDNINENLLIHLIAAGRAISAQLGCHLSS